MLEQFAFSGGTFGKNMEWNKNRSSDLRLHSGDGAKKPDSLVCLQLRLLLKAASSSWGWWLHRCLQPGTRVVAEIQGSPAPKSRVVLLPHVSGHACKKSWQLRFLFLEGYGQGTWLSGKGLWALKLQGTKLCHNSWKTGCVGQWFSCSPRYEHWPIWGNCHIPLAESGIWSLTKMIAHNWLGLHLVPSPERDEMPDKDRLQSGSHLANWDVIILGRSKHVNWLSFLGQKADIRINEAGKMPFSPCLS